MPTRLTNGTLIVNVTPHPLHFWCEDQGVVVTAPSDAIVNAYPRTKVVQIEKDYHFVRVEFVEREVGRKILNRLKLAHPEAVIVGSIIAAQAYRGEIVSSIPYKPTRFDKDQKLVKYDRFTIFPKEIDSNGS